MYPSGKGFNPQTHQEEGTFQELFNQALFRVAAKDGAVNWTKRYKNWVRKDQQRITGIVNQWKHEEETGTIYGDDPYMQTWYDVCDKLQSCIALEHRNQSVEEMLSTKTSTTFPSGDSSEVSGTSAQEMDGIRESSESGTAEGSDEERGDMEAEYEYGRGEERTDIEGKYEDGRGDERAVMEAKSEDGSGEESGENLGKGREVSQNIPEQGQVAGWPANPGVPSGEIARWPENRAECKEVTADPGQAEHDNRWRAVE